MNDFTSLSKQITDSFTSIQKKQDGIFFTPLSIIQTMIDRILQIPELSIQRVLEPSCGSCEIIAHLLRSIDPTQHIDIIGIEKNTQIYDQIQHRFNDDPRVSLLHRDFLQWDTMNEHKFDLIIGNPPYFVVSKESVDETFYSLLDGRPNIFVLFLIHSLQKLREGGVLAFVLPHNFINCLYYSKIRNHIHANFAIIDIIDCMDDSFLDTKQETFLFILQKKMDKTDNQRFGFFANNDIVFHTPENISIIHQLYHGSVSLFSMGFDINVGTVVWNQYKDILTDDDTRTRLIYSGDIKNNQLTQLPYKNPCKKHFIMKDGINEPVLVINRGYGKGKYTFSYCIIDIETPFLVENHLIVIRNKVCGSREDHIRRYQIIIDSFTNEKTAQFVDVYFGNNAINTTELKHVLPIYPS